MRKNIRGPLFLLLIVALLTMVESPAASRRQKLERPNILFAIADDWSYGHAGAYGSKFVRTPAFDRVARAGVLYTRAFTPNAKCSPSRAIILTGRNSWQLEEAANHIPFFPAKFKTWVEALGENGYFTRLTSKGWAPGVANDAKGKPRQMAGRPFNQRKLNAPAAGIENNDYAANFDDFLIRLRGGTFRPASWANARRARTARNTGRHHCHRDFRSRDAVPAREGTGLRDRKSVV